MIKITKSHLRDMVLEAASRLLNETTRRQKAQRAINGKYVRAMAILTSENPMGNPYPEGLKTREDESGHTMEFNMGRRDDLEMRLSTGYYSYFKVKGQYGSKEKSYIIYNIPLSDTLYLGQRYNQESVIFIQIEDDGNVSYEYWKQNGDGNFSMTHKRTKYIDMSDADDLFTKISRKFKFQIPFFDGSDENGNELNEQIAALYDKVQSKGLTNEEVNRRTLRVIDENLTGKARYASRGTLYGDWK